MRRRGLRGRVVRELRPQGSHIDFASVTEILASVVFLHSLYTRLRGPTLLPQPLLLFQKLLQASDHSSA